MKIVIISEYNKFISLGGTEYYVEMLIKGLLQNGHEVIFITQGKNVKDAYLPPQEYADWKYKAIYLPARKYSRSEITQLIISSTWKEIRPILESVQPDLIHVHTYSTFFNVRHFEQCNKYFRNIIFTSHIASHFCPKGDLIKFNKSPCDGIIYSRCALCLFSKGLKYGINNLVFQYQKKVLERMLILSRLGISLICVSEWQKQHAIGNGFDSRHVSVIRQAIHTDSNKEVRLEKKAGPFSVGYLGRLSAEKGSVFLIELIEKMLKTTAINFVLGIPRENSNHDDMKRMEALLMKGGDRLRIMDHINVTNKAVFFKEIDCLLIASFCVETGPIVLLEAVQYGKQVLGPNIGGPLEFKKEFPGSVTTYSWNKLDDAVEKINLLSGKDSVFIDSNQILAEKEELFIKQHSDLYTRLKKNKRSSSY